MKFLTIIMSLWLTACSTISVFPKQYETAEKDKYMPINVDIDAGRYIGNNEVQMIEFIQSSMVDSGLYMDVETRRIRYPFTVQFNYAWEIKNPNSPGHLLNAVVSGLTLFLVPMYNTEQHVLEAEIFLKDRPIYRQKFKITQDVSLSLFNNINDDRRDILKQMIAKMHTEIADKKIIPTIDQFNQASQNKVKSSSL